MVQRPRSHQLETESRRAFSSSLPSLWVFRDLSPDYGLDGLVEVFDPHGRATGDLFFVQLKATDEKDVDKALRVRLTRRVSDYYNTLLLPVLLVVYHSPTRALYARWLPEQDPVLQASSQTTTVWLHRASEWGLKSLSAIMTELQSLKEAKLIGKRELRIQRYYDARRTLRLADTATGPRRPVQQFRPGDRVFHGAFGFGVIDNASDSYFVVRFDEDDVDRKFLPGSSWEFTNLGRST